ncbi:glycosyltransferase [Lutimonas saemankumensis]|uniref:glycosyltransferase n=1 Tax=Lutimonas saemankumensis TaxID=483016 RepID=UPI001CD3936A|nr:glycosyltransferase [Lutimonas saemankumensis]MCA0932815.1 glycosyltransferase [Lutimonas saemankumensis]
MNRIIISASNDLATDQRIHRTCECFNELGFEILLIGRRGKTDVPCDKQIKVKRFSLLIHKGFLFYAELNFRLFLTLLFSRKQILYSNDLDTLLPNYLVSKLTATPLIYDSHELFTEVPELISRNHVRNFWMKLEEFIFPRLKNVITVNRKIAEFYSAKYGVPITVIRNVPIPVLNLDHKTRSMSAKNNKIIYQGSLNLGRGIELMIDAMQFLPNYKLNIFGDGDISDHLRQRVFDLGLDEQISFAGRLNPKELKTHTKQSVVGLSLEEDLGLNYRYCLPNKVFDYIHGGIPIIVSDLPLLSDLVSSYKIGKVLKNRDPQELASTIVSVVKNKKSYLKNLEVAANNLNWNNEKIKLKNVVKNIR